jgi:hypothetical protein
MLQVIAPTGVVAHRERAAGREGPERAKLKALGEGCAPSPSTPGCIVGSVTRVQFPLAKTHICGSTFPSSFSDGPLIMGYLVKSRIAG